MDYPQTHRNKSNKIPLGHKTIISFIPRIPQSSLKNQVKRRRKKLISIQTGEFHKLKKI
jgi:hypothetical protein